MNEEQRARFEVGVHLSDWNMEDKAYLIPESKIFEYASKIKKAGKDLSYEKTSDLNNWLLDQGKQTKGVEDMDIFLSWTDPYDCVIEWEEYFDTKF